MGRAGRDCSSTVLVVCAHPDDEAIGCGGTLRRHVLDGDDVSVVFLTSGEGGGHGDERHGQTREREAHDAADVLGLQSIEFWREPDGRLRATRELTKRLAALMTRLRPALVYAPHGGDDHADHRAAARLARQALAAAGVGAEMRCFEIWSPLVEIAELVDVSEVIEDKLRAIRAYRSQCAVMRFDEAFLGLARYRGEMHSWPGGPYAEAFSER
jgi:LmbE family N-acetylglucosaminyl deacetylase